MFVYWLQLYVIALFLSILLSLVDFVQVYVIHDQLDKHTAQLPTNLDNYLHESYLLLVCILACGKSFDLIYEVYKWSQYERLNIRHQEQHRSSLDNISLLPMLHVNDQNDIQPTDLASTLHQIDVARSDILRSRYLVHAINGRQYFILFWCLATNISFIIAVYSLKLSIVNHCLTALSGCCLALQMIPRSDVKTVF